MFFVKSLICLIIGGLALWFYVEDMTDTAPSEEDRREYGKK